VVERKADDEAEYAVVATVAAAVGAGNYPSVTIDAAVVSDNPVHLPRQGAQQHR
jgi:hypothetical protein